MDVTSSYSSRKEVISLLKSTLVKGMLIIGGISTWAWFCAVKIPEYQQANREVCNKHYIAICEEHKEKYVDIIDCNNIIHAVPRDQYESEQLRLEQEEEVASPTPSATPKKKKKRHKKKQEDPYTRYTTFSHKYSDTDVELLARLVHAEAGIESYQCKLKVASVVLNRCASENFPETLQEVIFQRSSGNVPQFSVTIVQSDGSRPIDCEPSKDARKAARDILEKGSILPLDVQYFYSTSCNSTWLSTRETYEVIDHTIFAYQWRK